MTKTGHVYTPKATKDYEKLIQQCFDGCKLEGAISASITVSQEPPKKFTKEQRQAALQGKVLPTIKPDCDNILKIVLDGLNGLAYDDDKQVTTCRIRKAYGYQSAVHIKLSEIDTEIKIGGSE